MKNFTFVKPCSVYEVVDQLTRHGEKARMLAGGTDLIITMKQGIRAPEYLVNLKSISGLAYIRKENGHLCVGANTLLANLESSPLTRENYAGLAHAAHQVASVQIQSVGTVGGNLCQDAQCLYYRNPHFNCYRKGGEKCFAFDGENKYGALFVVPGSEKCWAGYPSDLAPMLMALGAKVKIFGPVGTRALLLDDFYTELGNCLQPGELLVEVQIPAPPANANATYLKYRVAKGIGFPVASAAVLLSREGERCGTVRVALGGVAPMPWRAAGVEEALTGQILDRPHIRRAAETLSQMAKPLKKSAYKESIIIALVERALLAAGRVSNDE